jgi:hypothetical protein
MAPTCGIPKRERYGRMAIGSGFVLGGFLVHRDPFVALTMVTVGSAMAAAASLGQ